MTELIATATHQPLPFQSALRKTAPVIVAIAVGSMLGVCWALGMRLAVFTLVVPVVLAFLAGNWVRWFFVTLCAVWLSPVILGLGFVSDLSPSDPIIFVLFLLYLARAIAERRPVTIGGPFFVPFLLFLTAHGISAAVMVFRSPTLFFYKDLYPFVKLIETYLLCVMVITEVKRGNLNRMLLGSGIIAAAAVGVGFVEYLGDFVVPALKPFSTMVREHWYNPFWQATGWATPTVSMVAGTFDGYPYYLGAFASLFSITFFACALYGPKKVLYRGLFSALCLLGLATVVFTGSRGALLNSIAGLGGVLLLAPRTNIPRNALIGGAVGLLILILIIRFSPYGERFQAITGFLERGARIDKSFHIRVAMRWRFALEEFLKSPIVGRGTAVKLQKGADNVYFDILQNAGILGLVSLCYLYWHALRCGISVWRAGTDSLSRVVALGLTCGLIGMSVQSFTADIFPQNRLRETYWIVFGIIAGMCELSKKGGMIANESARGVTHVP